MKDGDSSFLGSKGTKVEVFFLVEVVWLWKRVVLEKKIGSLSALYECECCPLQSATKILLCEFKGCDL